MNIELLERIKAKILEEPENFQMDDWHCGTAHCIAGWAQVLSKGHEFNQTCQADVAQALRISHFMYARSESDRLFHELYWPEQFRKPCTVAGQRAKQAVARISWFIKTEGKE